MELPLNIKAIKRKDLSRYDTGRDISEFQADILLNAFGDDWVDRRDKAVLGLMYGSGLRISEALSLTMQDMNADPNTGIIITGKNRTQRMIYIMPVSRKYIMEYLDACPFNMVDKDPIFRGEKGGVLVPRIIQRRVKQLREQLELPKSTTPHSMRHSFATHLLTHGADIEDIRHALGHKNLSTTQVYIGMRPEHLLNVYAKCHPRS